MQLNKSLHYSNFATSEQIAKDNASLSFGLPLGEPLDIIGVANSDTARTPGIFAYTTALTLGKASSSANDPITKASQALYTKYWEKNSAFSSFQRQDVAVYTFATAQLVALLSWLTNIYGVRKISNPNSKYVKNGLWHALGVDPTDIQMHLTDLRGYINLKAVDLQNTRLDASIPLYAYASEMYKYIYLDSPNTNKTQYYVARPSNVLKYFRDTENIGNLRYVPVPGKTLTYAQLTAFVDSIFEPIFNSSYFAAISSAIGKAGAAGHVIGEIHDDYVTPVGYDERALIRLKNATIWNGWNVTGYDQNVVNQALQIKGGSMIGYAGEDVMNYLQSQVPRAEQENAFREVVKTCYPTTILHVDSEKQTTPQEVIVLGSYLIATEDPNRLSVDEHREGDDSFETPIRAMGFEVVTSASVITGGYYNNAFEMEEFDYSSIYSAIRPETGGSYSSGDLAAVQRIARFAKDFGYIPDVNVVVADLQASETGYALQSVARMIYADYDLFTQVKTQDIEKLHRAAIYSILGVPVEA